MYLNSLNIKKIDKETNLVALFISFYKQLEQFDRLFFFLTSAVRELWIFFLLNKSEERLKDILTSIEVVVMEFGVCHHFVSLSRSLACSHSLSLLLLPCSMSLLSFPSFSMKFL